MTITSHIFPKDKLHLSFLRSLNKNFTTHTKKDIILVSFNILVKKATCSLIHARTRKTKPNKIFTVYD